VLHCKSFAVGNYWWWRNGDLKHRMRRHLHAVTWNCGSRECTHRQQYRCVMQWHDRGWICRWSSTYDRVFMSRPLRSYISVAYLTARAYGHVIARRTWHAVCGRGLALSLAACCWLHFVCGLTNQYQLIWAFCRLNSLQFILTLAYVTLIACSVSARD